MSDAAATRPFAERLLAWYRRNARDLPWRGDPEPWPVWVSEVMAQQTRLEVVLPAWRRFIAEFPTPADWARVDDETLQRAWRGLGYYRRARLLRDGARAVVERHGGEVPGDAAALAELPGVGEYTRAAIGSIAFGLPLAAIDGNLERVLTRHAGIREPVRTAAGRRVVRTAAEERLDCDRAGDWNQALMDLGSSICTPRSPSCLVCPIAADCDARARGDAERLPILPERRKAVSVTAASAWIDAGRGRIWARTIPAGEVNAGQLDLPGGGPLAETADLDALVERLRGADHAAAIEVSIRTPGEPIATVRHSITHHRITLHVYALELACTASTARAAGWRAVAPGDTEAAWSTPARKVFAAVGDLATGANGAN